MTAEQTVRGRRWLVAIAVVIGFSMEFFLIPLPRQRDVSAMSAVRGLLTSDDFYYALVSPLVIWWFAGLLRRRTLGVREIGIAYLAFGFYLSSALRALATTVLPLVRLAK
jgi:hypothetical protein